MLCGDTLYLKVCSSTTTAVTASTASCGTFKFITVTTVASNTVCTPTQLVLLNDNEVGNLLASPFNMTTSQGGAIGAGIFLVFAVAWGIRKIVDMFKPSRELVED